MIRAVLGQDPGVMPVIALLLFSTLAVLVTLYLLTDRRRAHHRAMERMPLEDGTIEEGRRHG